MKKLTALLFACMMMTCTFTACGDKSRDDGSSKKINVSAPTAVVVEKTSKSADIKPSKPAGETPSIPKVTIVMPSKPNISNFADFEGSWESVMISENGYAFKEELDGVSVKGLFRIEAFEDGTGYAEVGGEKSTFKWEKKDVNKIVITDDSDGEKDEVVIYGKRFVMSDAELSITFEKVN